MAEKFWQNTGYSRYLEATRNVRKINLAKVNIAKAVTKTTKSSSKTVQQRVNKISPANTYHRQLADQKAQAASTGRWQGLAERYAEEQRKERVQAAETARWEGLAKERPSNPYAYLQEVTTPPVVPSGKVTTEQPKEQQFKVAPNVSQGQEVYVAHDPKTRTNIVTTRDTGVKLVNYSGFIFAAYSDDQGNWHLDDEVEALGITLDMTDPVRYTPDLIEILNDTKTVEDLSTPIKVEAGIQTGSPLYYDPILNQITSRPTQERLYWTPDKKWITQEHYSLDTQGNTAENLPVTFDSSTAKFLSEWITMETAEYQRSAAFPNVSSPAQVAGQGKVTEQDMQNMYSIGFTGETEEGTTLYLSKDGKETPIEVQPGTPYKNLPYQWRGIEETIKNSKFINFLYKLNPFYTVDDLIAQMGTFYAFINESSIIPKQSQFLSQESTATRKSGFGSFVASVVSYVGTGFLGGIVSLASKVLSFPVSLFEEDTGKAMMDFGYMLNDVTKEKGAILDQNFTDVIYSQLERPSISISPTVPTIIGDPDFGGWDVLPDTADFSATIKKRADNLNATLDDGTRLLGQSEAKYEAGLTQEAIEDRTEGNYKYYVQGLDWAAINNYIASDFDPAKKPVQSGVEALLKDDIPITQDELKALWRFVVYNNAEDLRSTLGQPQLFDRWDGKNYHFLNRVSTLELQKGRRLTLGELYEEAMVYMVWFEENGAGVRDKIKTDLQQASLRRHDRAQSLFDIATSYLQQADIAKSANDTESMNYYLGQSQAYSNTGLALLVDTYDIDRKAGTIDPFSAYSWKAYPDKKDEFYLNVARAEAQLGRPPTRQEITDISYLYVDMIEEIGGESIFDALEVLEFAKLGKLAALGLRKGGGLTAKALRTTKWGSNLVDAYFSGMDQLVEESLARQARRRALLSVSHKQSQLMSDLTTELFKTNPRSKEDFLQLVGDFGNDLSKLKTAASQEEALAAMDALARKYHTVSPHTIKELSRLNIFETLDAGKWVDTFSEVWDEQLEFMLDRATTIQRRTTRKLPPALDAAAEADRAVIEANRIRNEAMKNMFSSAGKHRLGNEVGDKFRRLFVQKNQAWAGSVFMQDTWMAKLGGTWVKNPTPGLVKWRGLLTGANKLYRRFMNAWVWATLARRPAWMIYNFLDNTFRFFVSGGTSLNDILLVMRKSAVGDIAKDLTIPTGVTTDMTASTFRVLIEPLEGGAKIVRQLPGVHELRDNPLGFFQHYRANYRALTAGKGAWSHTYAIWRAFPMSVKSLASTIEYGSRIRLWWKLYTRNMAKANSAVLARLINGFGNVPGLKQRLLDAGFKESDADHWVRYILQTWDLSGSNSQRFLEAMQRLTSPNNFTNERMFIPESILNSTWFDETTFRPLMINVMDELRDFVGEQAKLGKRKLNRKQTDQFFDRIISVFDAEAQIRLNTIYNQQFELIRNFDVDEGIINFKAGRYDPDDGVRVVTESGEEAIQDVPTGTTKLTPKQRKRLKKAATDNRITVPDDSDESLLEAADTLRERSAKTAKRKPITDEEARIIESNIDDILPADTPRTAAEMHKMDEAIRTNVPRLEYNEVALRQYNAKKDLIDRARKIKKSKEGAYVRLSFEEQDKVAENINFLAEQATNLSGRVRTFWIEVYPGPKRYFDANRNFSGAVARRAWDGYFSRGSRLYNNLGSTWEDLIKGLDGGTVNLNTSLTAKDVLDMAGIVPEFDNTGMMVRLRMFDPATETWQTSTSGVTVQRFQDITGIHTQLDYTTDIRMFDSDYVITENQALEIQAKINIQPAKSYDEMIKGNPRLALAVKEKRFRDANIMIASEFHYPMFYDSKGRLIPADNRLLNKVNKELGKKYTSLDEIRPAQVHKALNHWSQTNQGIRMEDMLVNLKEDFVAVLKHQYDTPQAEAEATFELWETTMRGIAEITEEINGVPYTVEDAWLNAFDGFYAIDRTSQGSPIWTADGRLLFYSPLNDLVNRHMTDGMTGSEVLALAKKRRLSMDELEWNGLAGWLNSNKDNVITREVMREEIARRERFLTANVRRGEWKINIKDANKNTLNDLSATFHMNRNNTFSIVVTKKSGELDEFSLQRLQRWAKDNDADFLILDNKTHDLKKVPQPSLPLRPESKRYLGSTEFIKGEMDKLKARINSFSGSNLTTFTHETYHAAEELLPESAKKTLDNAATRGLAKFQKDNPTSYAELYGALSPEAARKEYKARMFEKYLITEKAPTAQVAKIFQAIRNYMVSLYKSMKGYFDGIYVDYNVRRIYDQMVSGEWKIGKAGAVPQPKPPVVPGGAGEVRIKTPAKVKAEVKAEVKKTAVAIKKADSVKRASVSTAEQPAIKTAKVTKTKQARPVQPAIKKPAHNLDKPTEMPVVRTGIKEGEEGTVIVPPSPGEKKPRYRAPKTNLSLVPEEEAFSKPFAVPKSKPVYVKEEPINRVLREVENVKEVEFANAKWMTNATFYRLEKYSTTAIPSGATARDVIDEAERAGHTLRVNSHIDLRARPAQGKNFGTQWVGTNADAASSFAKDPAKVAPVRYNYFRILAEDENGNLLIEYRLYRPHNEDMAEVRLVTEAEKVAPPPAKIIEEAPPQPEDVWPEGVLPAGEKPSIKQPKPAPARTPKRAISAKSKPKNKDRIADMEKFAPDLRISTRKAFGRAGERDKAVKGVSKAIGRKIHVLGVTSDEQLSLALRTILANDDTMPANAEIIIGITRGRGGNWSLRAGEKVQETVDDLMPKKQAVIIDPTRATKENFGAADMWVVSSTGYKEPDVLFQQVPDNHRFRSLMDILQGPNTEFRVALMDLLEVTSRDGFMDRMATEFAPIIDEIADKLQASGFSMLFNDFSENEQEALRFLVNNFVDPNYTGLYDIPHKPLKKYSSLQSTPAGDVEWIRVSDLGLEDIQSPYQFTDLFVNANSRFMRQINEGKFPKFTRTSSYMMEALERRGFDGNELLDQLDTNSLFTMLISGRRQAAFVPPNTAEFRAFIEPSEVKHLVHHATTDEFTSFNLTHDIGYHFGDLYTATRHRAYVEDHIIHDYWIRITKSLELPDMGNWDPYQIVERLVKKGMLSSDEALALTNEMEAVGFEAYRLYAQISFNLSRPVARDQIIDMVDQLYHQFPILAKHGNFNAEDLLTEFTRVQEYSATVRNIPLGDLPLGELLTDAIDSAGLEEIMRRFEGSRLIAELNSRWGYDGIRYTNTFEGRGSTSYIVFYNTNIKRVDNIGTYDTTSSNVLWQMLSNRADGAEKRIGVSRLALAQWTQTMNSMIDNYHTLFIDPRSGFMNANVLGSYTDALSKPNTAYLIGNGFDYVARNMGDGAADRYIHALADALRKSGLEEIDVFHMGDARFVIQMDDPTQLDEVLRAVNESPTVRVADQNGELWDIDLSLSHSAVGTKDKIPQQFEEAQAMSEAARSDAYRKWLLENGETNVNFRTAWEALDDADRTGAEIVTHQNIRPAEKMFEEVDTDDMGTLFQRVGADDTEPLYVRTNVPDNEDEIAEAWRAFVQSPILERGTERVSLQDLWGVFYGSPEKLYEAGPTGFGNLTEKLAEELAREGMMEGAEVMRSLSALSRNFKQYIEGSVIKLDALVPPPIPFFQMDPVVRNWISNLYGVGSEWSNGRKLLTGWKDEFGKNIGQSPMATLKLSPEKSKALDDIAREGADLKRQMDNAVNYGGEVSGMTIPHAGGAVVETNFTMIDYTEFSKIDQFMKDLIPFWMYPSKSVPFWLRTLVQHPYLVAFYNKYLRWSKMIALQSGAVNSRGEQLPSLKGYIPILPGLWFNPLSPFMFRYAFPRIDTIPEEEELDPLQAVAKFFLDDAPVFGINISPVTSAIMQTLYDPYYPKTNLGYELTKAVIPIEFIPPFAERWIMDKVRQVAQGWSVVPERFEEEVSWKDYLIERQILTDALLKMDETDDELEKERLAKEAYKVVTRADESMGPREQDPVWLEARAKVENSEYYRRMVGMFTGMYTKEFSSGYAELISLRNEVNTLRDSINNEINAILFQPYMTQSDIYKAFNDRRFEYSDTWIWQGWNLTRFVTDEEGNQLSGKARRDAIAEEAVIDNQTQLKYQAIREAIDRRDERLRDIPVGANDLREQIWNDYFTELDKIDDPNGLYPLARQDYYLGHKPPSVIKDDMEGKWWRMLKTTYPSRIEGETYTQYDLRVEAWKADLPQMAKRLAPVFLTSLSWRVWDEGRDVEDRMAVVDQIVKDLVSQTTADGYNTWTMKNDTPIDAVWAAYQELYLTPYYNSVKDKSGIERQLAETEFFKSHPYEPTETEIYNWILDRYGINRFTQKEIFDLVRGSDFATPDEIVELSNTPPDPNKEIVFDILAWAGPQQSENYQELMKAYIGLGGYESDFDVWWGVNGDINNYPDVEEYYDFVDRVQQAAEKVGAAQPTEQQLRDMLEAETAQAEFKAEVMSQLGSDFYNVLAVYMYMNSDDRKEWRNANPDLYKKINTYFNMRDAFASTNPLWATYYYPSYSGEEGAAGGGGAGGGWSGTGYAGSTFEREESDWWLPQGRRATLDAMALFGSGKLGSGGVVKRPWWPEELLAMLDPVAVEQVNNGTASEATVTYLKKVAKKHPEYATVIRRNLTMTRGYSRTFSREHQEVMQ